MDPIVHLMLTINCSVNVVFYCFFDSGYRYRIFSCIKNNQEKNKKISSVSLEGKKEEDTSKQLNSLTSPENDEEENLRTNSNRDFLFPVES